MCMGVCVCAFSNASHAYTTGMKIATQYLPAAHPARLRLALNHAVLQHEILSEPVQACKNVYAAIREADKDTATLQSLQTSAVVLRAVKENYASWVQALTPGGTRARPTL